MWDSVQDFFLDARVCEECAPYLPVEILLGRSGFGNSLGHVEDAASENIQEIISLVVSLIWNDASVCGGRMELKYFVRDWYEILKSLEIKSTTMLLITLMC